MIDASERFRAPRNAHARRDDEKLRLHRAIAQQLLREPERVLGIAEANLRRWRERDEDTPYYEEWEDLLRTLGVQELAALIVSDSEEARRLRQSTPFVGVVPREERDTILGIK
jgi:hypothetical protein